MGPAASVSHQIAAACFSVSAWAHWAALGTRCNLGSLRERCSRETHESQLLSQVLPWAAHPSWCPWAYEPESGPFPCPSQGLLHSCIYTLASSCCSSILPCCWLSCAASYLPALPGPRLCWGGLPSAPCPPCHAGEPKVAVLVTQFVLVRVTVEDKVADISVQR